MPDTANGLPYPASTATPDVPRDIEALATALDDTRIPGALAAGQVAVTIANGSASGSAAVAFPGSRFGTTPRVIATVANASAAWAVSVSGVSAAGCTINLRHIDANTAGATVNVQWVALEGIG